MLSPDNLPVGFAYPESFMHYVDLHPMIERKLDPWGIEADSESNARYSDRCGLPLVQFAQAYQEDMIACFVVGAGDDPKVVVLNPWAQTLINDEWQETCQVLEELPNFEAWLEWARNSQLVKNHAEARAERAAQGK
jgi:hypothetical protein